MLGFIILSCAFVGWCFIWYWIGYKLGMLYFNWSNRRKAINIAANLIVANNQQAKLALLN